MDDNRTGLSCVATSVLRMRLLHAVAFSKKLPWLAQTKVITSKTKTHAVNARWKRLSQLSFSSFQNIIQGKQGRWQGFYKSLPWLFNRNLLLKNVKCRNIFLSQYCVQKYFMWLWPYRVGLYTKYFLQNNSMRNVKNEEM